METIEEKIKAQALKRYNTLTAFAEAADVKYTTLTTILKNGVMGASVQQVIKICRCLGVSVDGLENGELIPYERIAENDSEENLTAEERELIRKYRALDKKAQRRILRTLNGEYEDALTNFEEDLTNVIGHG